MTIDLSSVMPSHAPAGTTCVGCGYIVGTLSADAVCPECTTPVRVSMQGDALRHADPDYLAALARGTALVIAGTIVAMLWWVAAPLLVVTRGAAQAVILLTSIDVLAAILLLAGWWQVSSRNPAIVEPEADSTSRKRLRVLLLIIAVVAATGFVGAVVPAFAQAGLAGISGSVQINSASQFTPLLISAFALRVVHLVARALRFLIGATYLASLLQRAHDPDAARSIRRQRWLFPVWMTLGWLVVIGPLVGIVWWVADLDRARRRFRRLRMDRLDGPSAG